MNDDWHNLYRDGWQREIVPEAFAHPAKFSRALIRHIYEHMKQEGWLSEGDTVIDPFGGVALGGLDAMRLGLNWIGVELEPKFVDLGNSNIALWNARYSGKLPKWGSARIVQGDSRRLLAVVREAGAVVSSPPFVSSLSSGKLSDEMKAEMAARGHKPSASGESADYGTTPGQLASLREGDLGAALADGVVSSPPYANAINASGEGPGMAGNAAQRKRIYAGDQSEQAAQSRGIGYGTTDGNLGNLRAGGFEAATSSPPFGEGETRNRSEYQDGYVADMMSRAYTQDRQGTTDGNLAALRATGDGFEVAVSSPPYEGSEGSPSLGNVNKDDWGHDGRGIADRRGLSSKYGEAEGQIGHTEGDTFWSAARVIVEQTFAALRPGGHAVWTLKAFVRDGKRVDFPDQWRQLCESVGFETLHVHRAWLVEDNGIQPGFAHTDNGDGTIMPQFKRLRKERKSFFRRLAESKGSPRIDFETVICQQKPL